ncbi:hypothetical protein O0235_03200 [Tepidiforma flava]|uniref:DUF2795 domain-containing protein n=1 Tax=Tepidiforma flava TaxID=3004094 RepID=A0ABY7MBL6_9CHLR|nr:hypothetical protein [Tepidiforma flava]WBL37592.1 hypothetical protein O0235_03200 [Tepidiforma flava]
MPAASWNDIVRLAGPLFEQGLQPDRSDLLEIAFTGDFSDDVIDAIDSLDGKPIPTLDELRARLAAKGVLAD